MMSRKERERERERERRRPTGGGKLVEGGREGRKKRRWGRTLSLEITLI